MSKTILVVDDAESLRTMVKSYLTQEGYRVVTAANGREALFVARQERPDLILLDLMMPELGGFEFITAHSRDGDAPVIILTAKIEESDKVLGLELGADDYLTKPFSLRELTARIRAVLRRAEKSAAASSALLRVGELMLDRDSRLVTANGNTVELTPSEFDLLATMMASPGRVFSRLDLLDKLQGDTYEGYERTIDVHIRNLRTKIEPDPRNPRYVQTVYGIGYRLAADLNGN
ncbi:MAG: response regulator transcription factor [Candidatus Promineofilum sp.]|jgi:DNA-binding response OmpR family regulator|nr:response regulator transcription factor [Promineifilum sp.]